MAQFRLIVRRSIIFHETRTYSVRVDLHLTHVIHIGRRRRSAKTVFELLTWWSWAATRQPDRLVIEYSYWGQ